MILKFPAHFLWGSATSSAQIETPSDHNWKGIKARDGSIFDRTIDHELRREEDLKYIVQFGTVYRCGVDWARLQAAPFASFDLLVVEEYEKFFKQLKAEGMKIMLVLHHFSHPAWFEKNEGWLREENLSAFVDFAEQCIEYFGKYVYSWNTFNEPNVFALNAYGLGYFPPFKKKYRLARRAMRYMGQVHEVIYDLIKIKYPFDLVGISLNVAYFKPLNFLGILPAKLADYRFNWLSAQLFTKVDYLGLSYYAYVPFDPKPITEVNDPGKLDKLGIPHDKMWGYYPEGLGIMLRRFYKKYKLPIMITENGICTDDPERRIQSIKAYLHECHAAIQEGVELAGYIHWSTLDNFEWDLGPTYRFGLVAVDWETKERTMTKAGEFYAAVTSKNELNI